MHGGGSGGVYVQVFVQEKMNNIYEKEEILGIKCRSRGFCRGGRKKEDVNMSYSVLCIQN